ncbi:Lariat debranching enzyme [Cladobotryum mycophilum]|uniref:Lariat debranching enzyme n=1 Tax=Cladobotryum mycophilum TaxID=491253 RepID=A0ABR0SZ15_9HYPO
MGSVPNRLDASEDAWMLVYHVVDPRELDVYTGAALTLREDCKGGGGLAPTENTEGYGSGGALQGRAQQLQQLNSTIYGSPRRPCSINRNLPSTSRTMTSETFQTQGVRIAVEGCGHGTLNAIYASVAESCKARGWDGVDLLIIGGDFQSVRNAADLTVMSCPVKYRHLGDFPDYYAGRLKAPYLTIFIAGNHEASSHLWELYYGGWVAPNIYYMGAANVLRLGPIRIAGLSGIWKGHDYRKPHFERLPFSDGDVRSFYHVREIDVRKLLQIRTQVDVGLSHDWPRAIEKHGDHEQLFRKKRDFRQESLDGTLGSVAAEYVMDRLRPPYWFSAHMHIKFPAIKKYEESTEDPKAPEEQVQVPIPAPVSAAKESNPDEIDLDMDDESEDAAVAVKETVEGVAAEESKDEANEVSEELRAQLPASFAPKAPVVKRTPGQPVPPTIPNKEVRFLALDKCLPGRHFLQLCEIQTFNKDNASTTPPNSSSPRYRLQYDPEWLAITRAFHSSLTFGTRDVPVPEDLGEDGYLPLIAAERSWVEENIIKTGKLDVPDNFELTAPPYDPGTPEIVNDHPVEYTNPQTVAFCDLLSIENHWDATEAERQERRERGPPQDAGEVILEAPHETLRSLGTLSPSIRQKLPADTPIHGLLTADLVLDTGIAAWKGVLPTLADFEAGMPFLWPKDLQRLLPREAQSILENQQINFQRHWNAFAKAFPNVSMKDFQYAWLAVNSRSFLNETPETEKYPWEDRLALIPVADLFNHVAVGCRMLFSPESYFITTDRTYKKGEEVFISYGDHANDYMLVEYGFVLDDNQWDEIYLDDVIMPNLSEESKAELQKRDLLGKYPLLLTEEARRTQVVLRMLCCSPGQWKQFADGRERGTSCQKQVDAYMSELLKKFSNEIDVKLRNVEALQIGQEAQRALLTRRWNQIAQAVGEAIKKYEGR